MPKGRPQCHHGALKFHAVEWVLSVMLLILLLILLLKRSIVFLIFLTIVEEGITVFLQVHSNFWHDCVFFYIFQHVYREYKF